MTATPKIYQLEYSIGWYSEGFTKIVTTSLGDIYDLCHNFNEKDDFNVNGLWIIVWENGKVVKRKNLYYLITDIV